MGRSADTFPQGCPHQRLADFDGVFVGGWVFVWCFHQCLVQLSSLQSAPQPISHLRNASLPLVYDSRDSCGVVHALVVGVVGCCEENAENYLFVVGVASACVQSAASQRVQVSVIHPSFLHALVWFSAIQMF